MTLEEVAHKFNATRTGEGYTAHCPGHKDNKKSLCINQKSDKVVIFCQAGCDTDAVLAHVGLTMRDLFDNNGHKASSDVVATYVYRDLAGNVVYRKVRTADKKFFFHKPDGNGGWIFSPKRNNGKPVMDGVQRFIYRLNELRERSEQSDTADTFHVYIPEGEKDVDRLWKLGLPATTNDSGATKWTDANTRQLKDVGVTHVSLFPDNDESGRSHVKMVARSCHAAGIEVRIVDLPGLPVKGDVSDYLDGGHTDLQDRIAAARVYAPSEDSPDTPDALDTDDDDDFGPIEDLPTFMARVRGLPELTWHIPGLIVSEGIMLWHGQPRDFKTWCAIEAALAMAGGRTPFSLDRFKVARQVKVAYFAEEDSEKLFWARVHWLTAKTDLPVHCYFFVRRSLSFDEPRARTYIKKKLEQTGAQVAVFDPLRGFTGDSDKGPADLRPVVVFLRELQNETLAKAILLISHDTKPSFQNAERPRSQQASGGGIFSISDCPVSFEKIAWNQVVLRPEDYKVSGDPLPFEVTFESDEWIDESGAPRFGSYITPVAITKEENEIEDKDYRKYSTLILEFLNRPEHVDKWFTPANIEESLSIRKGNGKIMQKLLDKDLVRMLEGEEAKAVGARTKNSKVYSSVVTKIPLLGQ